MTKIVEIISVLERAAPVAYQESYDNNGLLVGDKNATISKILVTLDVTENVIDEAISLGCGLIIAHHPIIFKGIKRIIGSNYVERSIIKAIKNDIAIYTSHTNLDNVKNGVSFMMADRLQLSDVRILAPKTEMLSQLVFFVPTEAKQQVLNAVYLAGAGNIGNYSECSFSTIGEGTFTPGLNAMPTLGTVMQPEKVEESRVEVILPQYKEREVLSALRQSHPYEEVAYFITSLQNQHQDVGSGTVGRLPIPLEIETFCNLLKNSFHLHTFRHTPWVSTKIEKVAICGGAGSFLLKDAISMRADVFISSDFKYHEFFDAEEKITIIDIGHYESEQFTKNIFYNLISNNFPNIAVLLSNVLTNPVHYT